MKVFIGWSGDHSKQLAKVVHGWLPDMLQAANPYFSETDIEQGTVWLIGLFKALEEASVGLILLTPENVNSEWLMFEAGVIARSVGQQSKVCPILFGIKKSDLKGPLSAFQAAEFTKEDFLKVVTTINSELEKPLLEGALTRGFDRCWPDLEQSVKTILAASTTPAPPRRAERELIEENLLLTRTLLTQQQEFNQAITQLKMQMEHRREVEASARDLLMKPGLADLARGYPGLLTPGLTNLGQHLPGRGPGKQITSESE